MEGIGSDVAIEFGGEAGAEEYVDLVMGGVCLDRVDPEMILDTITARAVTHMCFAPVVLYMLVEHAGGPVVTCRFSQGYSQVEPVFVWSAPRTFYRP